MRYKILAVYPNDDELDIKLSGPTGFAKFATVDNPHMFGVGDYIYGRIVDIDGDIIFQLEEGENES